MPRVPGVNHKQAVRAFEKAGFTIVRQSGHIVMRSGERLLVIPRQNPIKPITMGEIVRASGLSVEEFQNLLK